MIADGNRRGYGLLLENFWDEARSHGLPLPQQDAVSAASFCEARHKIKTDLFCKLLHHVWKLLGQDFANTARWHGRRVFAVDGSKINLQRHEDLAREFAVPEGAHCPQVLVSTLFDVCAKVPLDLRVDSFATDERAQMLDMLHHLNEGDVLVLDRGYPSHEVLQALSKAKIDFLIRVPSSNSFKAIDVFRKADGEDYRLFFDLPAGYPREWKRLRLRVVKITNDDGEESYFITSLLRNAFSLEDLRELYHMRWEVEEFYKLMKSNYIGQGQFRSKSPFGVIQEIHAQMLFLAMSRYLLLQAARTHDGDHDELDHDEVEHDEVDQKGAVLSVAAYLTRIMLEVNAEDLLDSLGTLLKRMARHRYRKREGRSFPRRSFKPIPKWGAQGRRGA